MRRSATTAGIVAGCGAFGGASSGARPIGKFPDPSVGLLVFNRRRGGLESPIQHRRSLILSFFTEPSCRALHTVRALFCP
jgi:hypothetical protein